jgi:co-chaperonin GroES (HSP10)
MTQADVASDRLSEAFPAVDPGATPFGSRVLVQFRTPKKKTKGGIILTDETMETEKWNTQVAKVIAIGPISFKSRDKQTDWPEGAWVRPGDFVRVSKYGGDRWEVPIGEDGREHAVFAIFNDLDLIAKVTTDPLTMKAFI